jgi:hypothetical protein
MSPIGDSAISNESTITFIIVGDSSDLVAKKKNWLCFFLYYEDSLHKDHVFSLHFLKYIWDFEL